MKNLITAAVCLAALASPRPAAAYPDSGASYAVDAGGVQLTLLRDNRDPLLWYYLPASFTVAGAPAKRPELFLLKAQLPAGEGELEDAAALLAGLDLTLPPDVRQKAAAAVAALPVMDGKADPKNVRFDCVDLRDARLTVLNGEGAILAEAAADPSFTPLLDPARLAFTAAARGAAAARLGELALTGGELKLRVDYSYAAGPGPVFPRAAASGSAGFGAYTSSDRDKAILTLPPGQPEMVFIKLPQLSASSGIERAVLNLQLTDKDGKPLRVPAVAYLWRAQDRAWTDPKGSAIITAPLSIKGVFDRGMKRGDIWLKLESQVTLAGTKVEKAAAKAPLFSGDMPLSLPPSPFRPLTVSGDYVDFRGQDGVYAVQVAAKCGTEAEAFVLRTNKEGSLRPEPASVFFKDECKSLTLTVAYTNGNGKRAQKTISPGADERLVYLLDPE